MDDISELLAGITEKIANSRLSDKEKADIFVELSVGMRKLVWPILLAHVPEYILQDAADADAMTMEGYTELIESSFKNPATVKEMHDELLGALTEVEEVVTKALH